MQNKKILSAKTEKLYALYKIGVKRKKSYAVIYSSPRYEYNKEHAELKFTFIKRKATLTTASEWLLWSSLAFSQLKKLKYEYSGVVTRYIYSNGQTKTITSIL